MNIVFDCNDRLNRRVVMLESGACWIKDPEDCTPSQYAVVRSVVAVEILSFMLENQLGIEDLRRIKNRPNV